MEDYEEKRDGLNRALEKDIRRSYVKTFGPLVAKKGMTESQIFDKLESTHFQDPKHLALLDSVDDFAVSRHSENDENLMCSLKLDSVFSLSDYFN
jgi:hypothetical protein